MADASVTERATPARQLRSCLAAWFAALLALAPLARPSLPVDTGPVPAGAQSVTASDHEAADASAPATALRPAQPVGLGILSRLASVETGLGPAPAKSPLHRLAAAGGSLIAPGPTGAPAEAPRGGLERSSVGTARTPTGPPL